jgi:DHA1 family multidrug resistance protein-like MFS transporter
MPLDSEDAARLRAERDADPQRWASWDPADSLRNNYIREHPEQYPELNPELKPESKEEGELSAELERRVTAEDVEGPGAAHAHSTSSESEVEYQGIRTRPSLGRSHTSAHEVHRSETHRLNGDLETHPTALDRIVTHRSQHLGTVGSMRTSTKKLPPLPEFGAGKPYPPRLPDREEYVVEFDGADDPLHAQNWPFKKKYVEKFWLQVTFVIESPYLLTLARLFISSVVMFDSVTATFGSSIFSAASVKMEKHFHIGSEVGTLGTSLFVLGYAFGPILWAPFSELYGRRLPIVIAAFGFGVFALGVAVAKDVQTVMICRFFNGLFGSCPLAVVAAIFADIFNNETRGLAVSCFAASVFMGKLSPNAVLVHIS